jgi:hypothetical protein
MVVGFTWGGWVTGGSARTMAEKASDTARADLAATICVTKFMNGKDAATQLATLKQTSNWKREQFIQDGGWATLPGLKQPVRDGADTCAQRLAEMELPQGEQASGRLARQRRTARQQSNKKTGSAANASVGETHPRFHAPGVG